MAKRAACWLALALILAAVSSPAQGGPVVLRSAQPAGPSQEAFHVVRRGETLFSIAQRYSSTVEAFTLFNGLQDPTRIYAGQQLKIPPGGALAIGPPSTVPYVVQSADTLVDIARRHVTSWHDLAQLNDLLSPDVLHPGQVIQVPEGDHPGRGEGVLHVVEPDETLFRIALRHEVSPRRLSAANRIPNPALLYPGQHLLIPREGEGGFPLPFRSVDVHPLPVAQGKALVIGVRTTEPVTLTGELFEREIRFVEEGGEYYGLVGVHVFTEPGLYELTLTASGSDGPRTGIPVDVIVEEGGFGYERIRVAPGLLDPSVGVAESERLDALRPTFSESRHWSGLAQPPCDGTVSSYFGTKRAYNEGPYTSYHAGVDLRGATGSPVYAPAGGTVVLAEEFAVRGVALMLDHGWGILTGYWHLSEIEVEVGQTVEQGDLIARIGSTGLSTGSHLHWEMWVGGVNVDPMQWLEPFYPWPANDRRSSD